MKYVLQSPRSLLMFLVTLLFAPSSFAKEKNDAKGKIEQVIADVGIRFTENKGQVRDDNGNILNDVLFTAQANGQQLYFRRGGISYVFSKYEKGVSEKGPYKKKSLIDSEKSKYRLVGQYRTDINFVGTNHDLTVAGEKPKEDVNNYILDDSENGIMNVRNFENVVYKNIYKGIDLIYYVKDGELEYDFVIHPGANASQIKLKVVGADKLKISKDGSLLVTNPLGKSEESKPVSSLKETNQIIHSSFMLNDGEVSFNLGSYDHTKTLVIDPITRAWGKYFGGSEYDEINELAIDHSGNIIVGGLTRNTTGITTPGAYQESLTIDPETAGCFIAKFNSSGTRLWATYFNTETVRVAIDGCDNIIAAQIGLRVAKFDALGTLIWNNTYHDDLELSNVVVDASNNIIVAGTTLSETGVGTSGTHQPIFRGGVESYIIKINPQGNKIWGTYYGGESHDLCAGLGVGIDGSICISGETHSLNGIATPGTHKPEMEPLDVFGLRGSDAFLAKFRPNGTLQWGSYYGGNTVTHRDPDPPHGSLGDYISSWDKGLDVAIDNEGNVIMVGITRIEGAHGNGIASAGSHQPSATNNYPDGFIAKFNTIGERIWGTYYGGARYDAVTSVKVDDNGIIYVTGTTGSDTRIATPLSFQPTSGGGVVIDDVRPSDGFVAIFAANGVRQWASFYGGEKRDEINAIGLVNNNFIIAGVSESTNGISSSGTLAGGLDGFIAKFERIGLNATNPTRYISINYGGDLLPPSLCDNSTITIPFNTGGTFNAGNTFRVQLSDAAGSFASPINIGMSTSSFGNIPTEIPAGTPPGRSYEIRIASTNPVMYSCTETLVQIGIGPNTITSGSVSFCNEAPATVIVGSTPTWGPDVSTVVYQWQRAASLSGPWNSILGATSKDYSAPRSTSTYYYRRQARTTGGTCSGYSNIISRMVFPEPSYNGIILTDLYSCGPVDPPALDATTVSGGSGAISYQWQYSYDNIYWVPLPTVTTEDFNPSVISQTTYFRRMVSTTGCSSLSNALTVRIDQVIANNTIGATTTSFCNSIDPPVIIGSTPSGGTGSYSYSWQKSFTGSGGSWVSAGALTKDFDPPATSTTIYYRRRVDSGLCDASLSDIIGYRLIAPPTAQTIMTSASPSAICVNQSILLGITPYGGYTYQWKRNGVAIPSATSYQYTVAANSLPRGVYSFSVDISNGCSVSCPPVSISIEDQLSKNIVAGDPIWYPGDGCFSFDPPIIDGTTIGAGTYQWQSSSDSGVSWADISGATGEDYDPTSVPPGDTYFRRVSNSSCGTTISNVIILYGSHCEFTGGSAALRAEETELTIHPNPSHTTISIETVLNKNTLVQITMINPTGFKILERSETGSKGTFQTSIDVSTLTPGIYTVQTRVEQKMFTRSLIIR